MEIYSSLNGFNELIDVELLSIEGGAGLVNIISGITAVAGVAACVFPPAGVVAVAGGLFLIGYGIGEAIRK